MDIATVDNDGLKPMDLARDNNHDDAFKLLFRVMKSKILVRMWRESCIDIVENGV